MLDQNWLSTTLDGLFASDSIVTALLLWWNTGASAIAGALLLLQSLVVMVRTAQHGNLAPVHQAWWPIRVILGIGLVVPVTSGGLNFAEAVVIGAAKGGGQLADKAWSLVTDGVAKGQALAVPPAPDGKQVVAGLWQMAACAAIQNRTAQSSNAPSINIVAHDFDGKTILAADGDDSAGGIPGQCGSITFLMPSSSDDLAKNAKIYDAQMRAALDVLTALKSPADAYAAAALPQGQTPVPDFPTLDVGSLISEYSQRVMAAATATIQASQQSTQTRQDWADAASSMGWIGAGAWALGLSNTQTELQNAVFHLPPISPPHAEWWEGDTWAQQRAALRGADDFIHRQGVASAVAIQEDAYTAGLPRDSIFSFIDPARLRTIYTWLGAVPQGESPMSRIVETGHSMLNLASGVLTTYVVTSTAAETISRTVERIPVVGGFAGALVSTVATGMDKLSPGVWAFVLAFGLSGATLAFFIPAGFFVAWMFMIARYLTDICAGVLAAPLAAALHITAEEGAHLGNRAGAWWMMQVELLARPVLSVIALVLSLAVFDVLAALFGQLYYPAVRSTLAGHFGGISGLLAFSVLSVVILVALLRYSVGLIHNMPDQIMRLIGNQTHSSGETAHHTAAAVVTAPASSAAPATSAVSSQIGKRGEDKTGTGRGAGGTMTGTKSTASETPPPAVQNRHLPANNMPTDDAG